MATLPREVYFRYSGLVDLVLSAIDSLLNGTSPDKVTFYVVDAGFDPSVIKAVMIDELDKRGVTYRVEETSESSEFVVTVADNKEAHVKIYRRSILNVNSLEVFLKVKA